MPNPFICFPPPVADDGLLRASLPVYGSQQWNAHALLTHWLMSRGGTLVSALGPEYVLGEGGFVGIAPGDSQGFWYYIWPHAQNHVRQWNVSIGRNVGNVFGEIYLNAVKVADWQITQDAPLFEPQIFTFYQTINPPSGDPTPVLLQVTHDAASTEGGEPYVAYVSCYELPRVNLDAFPGVTPPNVASLASGQRIYEGAADKSLHAVAKAVHDARHQARRTCFYTYSNPDGFTTSSTSFQLALANIYPFPRQRWAGETSRNLDWAALVSHVGTPGSEIRVRSTHPAAQTVAPISDNGVFVTGTIEAQSEDPARLHIDGGMRDGNRNQVLVDLRCTDADEVTLLSFALAETE